MAVTITNSAGVPTEYTAYSLKTALLALRNRSIFVPGGPGFSQDVMQIADVTGQGQGLTGSFGRYGALTASEVAESAEYNAWQAFTPTTVLVTATKHQVGTIITKERMKKTVNPAQEWTLAGTELGRAMATLVNKDVCSLFASFTATSGGTTVDATWAGVRNGQGALRALGVAGELIFVLHEQSYGELLAEAGSPLITASMTRLAEGYYQNYYVDNIIGMRWYVTADVQPATTVDWVGGMFNNEAIGMSWGQDFELEVEWNKNTQCWEILLTCYYGCGIANQSCGQKHLTDY